MSQFSTNTTQIVDALGPAGHASQWIGCLLFAITSIGLGLHSTYVHKKERIFHLITMLDTAVLALAHYAMATGSGSTFIHTGPQGEHLRQIFYVRNIAWFFACPIAFLNPVLLAGLAWIDVFVLIVMSWIGMVCVFMATSLSDSWVMWGWYSFFVLSILCVLYIFIVKARHAAAKQPDHITSLYDLTCGLTFLGAISFIVLLALGDGAGYINVDAQTIGYTVAEYAVCAIVPLLLIYFYHKKLDKSGHGASAIPEHLYEHRGGGGVQLVGDD